jgi:N-acetyl-anhydromuramyl-L-alanine amidase AmpD
MDNTSIVICGQKFDIGTRVVLWDEPKGLNGYDESKASFVEEDRQTGKKIKKIISGKRYGNRTLFKKLDFEGLKKEVTQFFIHHSGLYHSDTTFNVLHNERKLSVHFILDDDGTLYQTLDLVEKALHGGKNNACSIGIEVDCRANASKLPDAYDPYHQSKHCVLPHNKKIDKVQGSWIIGYEFTDAQYCTLIKLAMKLCEIFPKLNNGSVFRKAMADFPRDKYGRIKKEIIKEPTKHCGFICHYHASENKIDPLAFDDWRFLMGVRDGDPMKKITNELFRWSQRQKALFQLGYNIATIDGVFGPNTAAALKAFQKDNGVKENGWGPKTESCILWNLNKI